MHAAEARLETALLRDRPALTKTLRAWRKRVAAGLAADRIAKQIEERLAKSCALAAARSAQTLRFDYPPELPVSQRRDDIADTLLRHQVVIVCGATGSGKTTQLPKLCLELGRGIYGSIAHTQPRRLAATSVARRIAGELNVELGDGVGYHIRFDERCGEQTRLKLMTDGILLQQIRHDPQLHAYDTLIIDEAHERSLNIDLLLGFVKRLLPTRPDLRVIITSATIDPERFARFFAGAPVLQIEGRSYPVEIRYRDSADLDEPEAIAAALLTLLAPGSGCERDVLVFLSGEREIGEAERYLGKRLRSAGHHGIEILPLYGRLPAKAQQRIFAPTEARRVILATNVAETSLTVPRVDAVIDTGVARISRYSFRSKLQRLPIEPVAQASANQRSGRCGRLRPGICVRLYSEDDFNERPAFTEAEIQRSNLAAVILRLALLGVTDLEGFPFLDRPDPRFVKDGRRLLIHLGALDDAGGITPRGREMAALPVDPRLARILLAGREYDVAEAACIVVAALSVGDPRERPAARREDADRRHAEFADARSEFQILLNVWHALRARKRELGRGALRRWCEQRFVNYRRMLEWEDVVRQLREQIACKTGGTVQPNYRRLHTALLTGLIDHIAERREGQRYAGARGSQLQIFPASALAASPPRWIVAAALIETSRVYAHTVAAIQPAWLQQAAPELLRRVPGEPYWDENRGCVQAHEALSLFGLALGRGRRIDYAKVDRELARRMFVEHALVNAAALRDESFAKRNRATLRDLRRWESRLRRSLIEPAAVFQFYLQRIPADCASVAGYRAWLAADDAVNGASLVMTLQDFAPNWVEPDEGDFPDAVEIDGNRLPLRYKFAPGAGDDGVTLEIPVALLPQIAQAQLDWLVPGHLAEQVAARLRALPKALRRQCAPLTETAVAFVAQAPIGDREITLASSLASFLREHKGAQVDSGQLQPPADLPHLQVLLRVLHGDGRKLSESRGLSRVVKVTVRREASAAPKAAVEPAARAWEFGALAEEERVEQGGVKLRRYPALVAADDGVRVERFTEAAVARRKHRLGVAKLGQMRCADKTRFLRRQFPQRKETQLCCAGRIDFSAMLDDYVDAVFLSVLFPAGQEPPRDADAFESLLAQRRAEVTAVGRELGERIAESLQLWRVAHRLNEEVAAMAHPDIKEDIALQLDRLVHDGFLRAMPVERLAEYPRYLRAVSVRLERIQAQGKEPAEPLMRLRSWRARYEQAWRDAGEPLRPLGVLADLRWLLEEYRVSLFAQTLRTRERVSEKRLEQLWKTLRTGA